MSHDGRMPTHVTEEKVAGHLYSRGLLVRLAVSGA